VYAQRASLIAFFVVTVWSRATLAGEPELKLGEVRESSLSPGQAQSFMVFARRWRFCPDRSEPSRLGARCQNLRSLGQALSRSRTGTTGGQTQTSSPKFPAPSASKLPPWTLSRRDLLPLRSRKWSRWPHGSRHPSPWRFSPRIQALEASGPAWRTGQRQLVLGRGQEGRRAVDRADCGRS